LFEYTHIYNHAGPATANAAVNTNALDKTLMHNATMTNAPNVVKKTMTQPQKRNAAAEAVVNAPPMTDGPTERIARSARDARRRSFDAFVFAERADGDGGGGEVVVVVVVVGGVFSMDSFVFASSSRSRVRLSLSVLSMASSSFF